MSIPDDVDVQFRDRVYQIKATEGVQVLIPPKFLSELKGLPEDVLSSQEAVSEVSSSFTHELHMRSRFSLIYLRQC